MNVLLGIAKSAAQLAWARITNVVPRSKISVPFYAAPRFIALHPGSRQNRYISPEELAQNYRIPFPHPQVKVWDDAIPHTYQAKLWSDFIHLYPTGDYVLSESSRDTLDEILNRRDV